MLGWSSGWRRRLSTVEREMPRLGLTHKRSMLIIRDGETLSSLAGWWRRRPEDEGEKPERRHVWHCWCDALGPWPY
jgi:hypothetical protein